jgi:uncharacterized Zn finger protein (UPF0148 family)
VPEQEVEALEQHVLHCGACLDRVNQLFRTQDTLAGVLREDTPCNAPSSDPVLEDLIKKLEALRPAPADPLPRGTPMITLNCPACGIKLSVKHGLAGKKVKCPSCSRVIVVHATAGAAVANDNPRPLPSVPLAEQSSQELDAPLPEQAGSERPTPPPMNKPAR